MIEILNKYKLRDLILSGISSEELNSKYDYSSITNMSGMFADCSNLESIPNLDTSKVTIMSGMFAGCSNLESIPNLDTSKVTDMSYMFYSCYNLKNINPHNYPLYDFSRLDNKFLKEEYPELYI